MTRFNVGMGLDEAAKKISKKLEDLSYSYKITSQNQVIIFLLLKP